MGNNGCKPQLGGNGKPARSYVLDNSATEPHREWQENRTESQARDMYKAEGTILTESSQIEFRTLLDYMIARKAMVEFISTLPERMMDNMDMCLQGWLEMKSFHDLPPGLEKLTSAKHIYADYIVGNMQVSDKDRSRIDELIRRAESDESVLTQENVFTEVQMQFFNTLHDGMFLGFRLSHLFQKMNSVLHRTYNHVKCSDFEYFDVLGEGGFGMVTAVRKKSTGQLYAMKFQEKEQILQMSLDGHGRADFERQAFASCKHPFIVELFFAFQTKILGILVMTLCTGRDLSHVLLCNRAPLSYDQVRFYTAEITSALSYFHRKGFLYRDLKPGNVILNEDGHIMLVDFGSACSLKRKLQGVVNNANRAKPLLAETPKADRALPLTEFWSKPKSTADKNNDSASPNLSATNDIGEGGGGGVSERSRTNGIDKKSGMLVGIHTGTVVPEGVVGGGSSTGSSTPAVAMTTATTIPNSDELEQGPTEEALTYDGCTYSGMRKPAVVGMSPQAVRVVQTDTKDSYDNLIINDLEAVGSQNQEPSPQIAQNQGSQVDSLKLNPDKVSRMDSTGRTATTTGVGVSFNTSGKVSGAGVSDKLQVITDESERENGSALDPNGASTNEGSDVTPTRRAHSLIGTFGYMAPEMVLLLMQEEGWTHTGYTKAVDWWSLGVTTYKLLTADFPFQNVFLEQITSGGAGFTTSEFGIENQMSGALAKYSSLFEEVNYSGLEIYPSAVDFISKLLVPEEKERMGYGHDGSRKVSQHPFFESVDWVLLERKHLKPPPLPAGWTSVFGKNKVFQHKYDTVEHMLFSRGKVRWLQPKDSESAKPQKVASSSSLLFRTFSKDKDREEENERGPQHKNNTQVVSPNSSAKQLEEDMQKQFENWDYTSAEAVKLEIGTRTHATPRTVSNLNNSVNAYNLP